MKVKFLCWTLILIFAANSIYPTDHNCSCDHSNIKAKPTCIHEKTLKKHTHETHDENCSHCGLQDKKSKEYQWLIGTTNVVWVHIAPDTPLVLLKSFNNQNSKFHNIVHKGFSFQEYYQVWQL